MSTDEDPLSKLALPDQSKVNAICDQFEEALRQGLEPRLESFLADTSGHVRRILFRELLLLECESALRRGRDVDESRLEERFPDRSESIREVVDQARGHLLIEAAVAKRASGASAWPLGLPETFGRFRLISVVGHGAFGTVFRAVDTENGNEVALKVPHLVTLVSPELRERFFREGRAAAALQHPGIVRLLEVGEEGMVCYIASEYVCGTDLAAWLRCYYERQERIPFETAARLVAGLAAAIQHAHNRGVFHCDLKPANILLRDGRATDPVVTDFGLARLVGEVTKLTLTGQILGTPAYMAPEQAFGTRQPLSPGPDVYGLGAILYEMLTGRPPFQGPTPLEIVLQKQNCEPTRPRVLTSRVPRDLETVCLKCLEKDPRRRYASADALADDLARWLRGESVRARRVGPLGNGLRWCRRKPIIAGLLGLLILSVTVGFSASLLLLRRAMAGEARAVENERREETARRDAEANAQEARQILGDLIHFSPKESSELGTPVPTKPDTEPLVRAESHCARLLREKPGDTDLRVTLTKVRGALGEIYCERGQIKEAEACFREARELWEELVVTDARSVECRARLAVTILWQAQAAAAAKEYARAFALKQSALALWQQLVVENPEDAGHLVNEEACRRQLILTAHSIWAVRQPLLHPLEKDVASLSEVVRAQPGDAALRHRLALTYVLLAEVLHGEGEADRAFVCWQHAHQQYRELVAARSNDLPARLALAHCCSRLMRAQISDPYYMEAVALFETTCPRVAALLQEQPNQDLPRSFLVEDYCSLAMCHAKAGAAALAADTCRKMMGNHSKAATDRSADPLASVDSMAQLSECLRAAGQIAPARAMAHDAVSLSARYDAFSSQDPGFSRRLAENSLRLSALLRHIGDPAESLHQAEMGLHRFQDLAQRTPALPVYSDVSNAWVAIAKARWDLGQPEEAVAAHWETVAAERRVFDLAPDERDNRARLSKCYGRLIDCGRHRARPAAIAKALLEQEKLWADNAEQLLKVSDNFRGLAGEVGHGKDRLSPEEQTERQGYLDQSERIKRAAEAVRRRADGPKSVASGTR